MRPEGQKQLKAAASSEALYHERSTSLLIGAGEGESSKAHQPEVPADVLTERFLHSVAKHYQVAKDSQIVNHLKSKLQ